MICFISKFVEVDCSVNGTAMRFTAFLLIALTQSRLLHSEFKALSSFSELKYLSELGSQIPQLLPPLLVPRVSGTEANKRVQEFIKKHFTDLGYDIQLDSFSDSTPYGVKEFTNIIASRGSGTSIVLACHFDSKYFKDFEFVGATDSSAPCAIIMDVAATLDKKLQPPSNQGIKFVFFDGEEAWKDWSHNDSLYGSRHLADLWHSQGVLKDIKALVLLDLLGSTDVKDIFNTHESSSWFWDRIVDVGIFLLIRRTKAI